VNFADIPWSPDEEGWDLEARRGAPAARVLALDEIEGLLCVPGGATAQQSGEAGFLAGVRFDSGRPLLFPQPLTDRVRNGVLDISLSDSGDPLLQYAYLSIVKNTGGEHNTAPGDPWYRRHLRRSARLLGDAKGLTLDVGCDDPDLSRLLFPPTVSYVGLDPGLGRRSCPCLAAMAEFLPLRSGTMDSVAFLTSLDHVLDYHAALDEAYRVLRPGGTLYLATLIWTARADLVMDHIHFHHFREFEIAGALRRFELKSGVRYNWKNDDHRHGVYLTAVKPGT